MYCPQCGKKFWLRNTFCPDCRVGLVEHPPVSAEITETPGERELPPEDPTTDMTAEEDSSEEPATEHSSHTEPRLTRLFTTANPVLIALAQSLLEDAGIEYVDQAGMLRGLGVDAGPVEFWVRGDEAARAREILQDVREASEQESPGHPEGEP